MSICLRLLAHPPKRQAIQWSIGKRCSSSSPPDPSAYAVRESAPQRVLSSPGYKEQPLWSAQKVLNIYAKSKKAIEGKKDFEQRFRNPRGIFANNELELSEINVYGFDYDYTLAAYSSDLHNVIYDLAVKNLINVYKYPAGIAEMPYNPAFAVRGLHFDIGKSLLMKIDSYHNVQLGSVYRGMSPVSKEDVREIYGGTHIPLEMLNDFWGRSVGSRMVHLIDMFSPPQTLLLANTVEYFIRHQIPFDSEYIYWDINGAIQLVHNTGQVHSVIMKNESRFLLQDSGLREFLSRINASGKKLFLITNSGYAFVNSGLTYLVGKDWRDLFDVVVCQARKPKFFYQTTRPFRLMSESTGTHSWDRVSQFSRGKVYLEGNLNSFMKLTGWHGSQVLYFGDHVYSDLADAGLKHGWRTGAIIPELEREIHIQSSAEFVRDLTWLSTLQFLIDKLQLTPDSVEKATILEEWMNEKRSIRLRLKGLFNPHFGSLFRTHHNPTYLSRRLSRFADVYTSALSNLLPFSLNHTFYPKRNALPHEWQVRPELHGLGH
ncbi:5'-nucleotidase domain-containing protein 3 [Hypsibius exemplaris]|uniref:5'-nucleotidase domain-containing protein 3 n=1 Tax=Hypsibius exemplaris TaxID=2072580 RepID=A0A1W0WAI9_HYPEX|nr:5'-nucleotidase domain-containing protein 3 [Hypsibius exemplaris]